jgi:hypothetical protein
MVGGKKDLADALMAARATDLEMMPDCREKLPDMAMTFEAETQEWSRTFDDKVEQVVDATT